VIASGATGTQWRVRLPQTGFDRTRRPVFDGGECEEGNEALAQHIEELV
jgi:hypothetical protein